MSGACYENFVKTGKNIEKRARDDKEINAWMAWLHAIFGTRTKT